MGVTPARGPTRGTRHPSPMRHIATVIPGIAGAPASTFTLHPHTTAIGMADPDISIIGITAGIVIGKVAQSLPTQWRELHHGDLALWIIATERRSTVAYSRPAAQGSTRTRQFRRCGLWSLSEQSGHRPGRANQARFTSTRPSSVRPKTGRSRSHGNRCRVWRSCRAPG
jgi:hypothetical protein